MRKLLQYIQGTIIKGLFFILPVLVFAYLIEKVFMPIQSIIRKASQSLDIEHFIGRSLLTILTILGFLVLCFFGGLLMRLTSVGRWKTWIEENVLRFTPGYLFIKEIVGEKLNYQAEGTKQLPVFVFFDDNWVAGILTEFSKENDIAVVYLPGSPNFNEGSVCMVKIKQIKILPYKLDQFKIMVQRFGLNFSNINIDQLPDL
ncbi:MAG: hypothetical protein EAZ12_06500 [Sphingobacteriia bacterium]|nr:MAG: hypothetical protein EAZ12_06500 [Sphingobacteriia bacterium]